MKKNKYLLGILAVLFAITSLYSCKDDGPIYEPAEKLDGTTQGVFFPSTNQAVFELEPTEPTQITLTIARASTTGAIDVPITVYLNTDDVFNAPSTVSFADGEAEKDFTVSFPNALEGKTYELRLSVQGEEFVNTYGSAAPYVATQVTRIKWTPTAEPLIYIDGTFATLFGVSLFPMYVEAERAEVTGMVRYRMKNAYKVPSGDGEPDADGIYDGYPYNAPGEFDESNDYISIIEIDNATKEVFMYAHDIGVDWGYGMISIGSVYRNLSENKTTYPLGKIAGDVITFGPSSLYFSMAGYQDGGKYPANNPTVIYLTKDAFFAANMKIEDFNDLEYVEIEGEVGEYESVAFNSSWNQSLSKAVDVDPENEDSEYKDLYYLSNLYANGYGVAFYYNEEEDKLKVVENQEIGVQVFGKELYVSQSDEVKSTVEVNAKGVTVYTLGLMFHFEDGTIVGDFAEKFYYSKEPAIYEKADFLGAFNMTGPSQFSGEPSADFEVTIAEGESADQLIITGIDYAEEVIAGFDAATNTLSIAPQTLADFVTSSAIYDMTLYTTTLAGDVSTTASIDLTFNMQGSLVIKPSSEADGYLIRSEVLGGWVDGYYGIEFSPATTRSAAVQSQVVPSFSVQSANFVKRETVESVDFSNFKISGNIYDRHLKRNVSILPIN